MTTATLPRVIGPLRRTGLFLAFLLAASEAPAQPPEKASVPPVRWKQTTTLDREDPGGTSIVAVAVSLDGKTVLSLHDSGRVRLWNAWTGNELAILPALGGKVHAIGFTADGKTFLTAAPKRVNWWDTATTKEFRSLEWAPAGLHGLALAPDGKTAAVGAGGGKVQLWPLQATAKSVTFHAHDGLISALAFSADAKLLATGGGDGTVKVWDAATHKEVAAFKGPGMVRSLAFAAAGPSWVLASAHGRNGVVLWDGAARKARTTFKRGAETTVAVALTPDGRSIAWGTANGTVRLRDVASGKSLGTHKAHTGTVLALAFGGNGRVLASASSDLTIKLWRAEDLDGKDTGEPKATAKELAILLADLKARDGVRAVQAVQALAGTPRQAVALLKPLLRPVAPAAPERIAQLLADLDSSRFPIREKAAKELELLGANAQSALKTALAGKLPLEVRRRLLRIVDHLEKEESPELVFGRRAVEVLERAAVPEARRLLEALAGGVRDAFLTRYARAALERLDD